VPSVPFSVGFRDKLQDMLSLAHLAAAPAESAFGTDYAGSRYTHGVTATPLVWIRRQWANPIYRFVLLFLFNLGVLALLYSILLRQVPGFDRSLTTATAAIEYWLINLFTSDVQRAGSILSLDIFSVEIIGECTGASEILIFTASVVAFQTRWRKKWIGLLIGIPLIYAFNVLRILMLLVVGRYQPSMFHFFHIYFWQATLILMIISVWLLWIYVVVRHEEGLALPS
jgi:archaeosortase B (VPXXXP-CTERM-specific)